MLALGPGRAMAASSGVVEVYGYQWSKPYQVKLADLQGSQTTIEGEQVTTYGMLEILQNAEGQQSPAGIDFTISGLSKIEIVFPGSQGKVTYSGDQIRSNSGNLASFYVNADNVTVMRVPGKSGSVAYYEYTNLNPQLYQPKQAMKNLKAQITPAKKTVKSGTKVTHTVKVSGAASGVKLSYTWSINGATQASTGPSMTTNFTGKSGDSFPITVQVTATGYNAAFGGAEVIIDKEKKKPKKDKPAKNNDGNNDGYVDDNYYVPGYNYYGGGGTGTGSGYPSGVPGSGDTNPSPKPEKKTEDQPTPVDNGLETVSGQLIDPNATITEITPPDSPSASGSEQTPQADEGSGGGGLSTGVKTALGLGALLGLGGLAEAGAFAGGLRRFRFRP